VPHIKCLRAMTGCCSGHQCTNTARPRALDTLQNHPQQPPAVQNCDPGSQISLEHPNICLPESWGRPCGPLRRRWRFAPETPFCLKESKIRGLRPWPKQAIKLWKSYWMEEPWLRSYVSGQSIRRRCILASFVQPAVVQNNAQVVIPNASMPMGLRASPVLQH
jgi:hypothetical protein